MISFRNHRRPVIGVGCRVCLHIPDLWIFQFVRQPEFVCTFCDLADVQRVSISIQTSWEKAACVLAVSLGHGLPWSSSNHGKGLRWEGHWITSEQPHCCCPKHGLPDRTRSAKLEPPGILCYLNSSIEFTENFLVVIELLNIFTGVATPP